MLQLQGLLQLGDIQMRDLYRFGVSFVSIFVLTSVFALHPWVNLFD